MNSNQSYYDILVIFSVVTNMIHNGYEWTVTYPTTIFLIYLSSN